MYAVMHYGGHYVIITFPFVIKIRLYYSFIHIISFYCDLQLHEDGIARCRERKESEFLGALKSKSHSINSALLQFLLHKGRTLFGRLSKSVPTSQWAIGR